MQLEWQLRLGFCISWTRISCRYSPSRTAPRSLSRSPSLSTWHRSRRSLLGNSLEEQARTTSVFLQVNEAFDAFSAFWFSTPEAERAEKAMAEVTEGATSKALAALKKYLDTVETDFVFGDSISLADLAIFNLRDQLAKFPDEVFPAKAIAIAAKVKQNEKLAAYLEQRPITPW
ncbi:MAG: hypothetical protein MHM6MM_006070 [Cercozoa sp. M6MM]